MPIEGNQGKIQEVPTSSENAFHKPLGGRRRTFLKGQGWVHKGTVCRVPPISVTKRGEQTKQECLEVEEGQWSNQPLTVEHYMAIAFNSVGTQKRGKSGSSNNRPEVTSLRRGGGGEKKTRRGKRS